jgi:hypothetical protein
MGRGAAQDGVHSGEDGNSERTTQQHALGEHGRGDIFEREMGRRKEEAGLLGRLHTGPESDVLT